MTIRRNPPGFIVRPGGPSATFAVLFDLTKTWALERVAYAMERIADDDTRPWMILVDDDPRVSMRDVFFIEDLRELAPTMPELGLSLIVVKVRPESWLERPEDIPWQPHSVAPVMVNSAPALYVHSEAEEGRSEYLEEWEFGMEWCGIKAEAPVLDDSILYSNTPRGIEQVIGWEDVYSDQEGIDRWNREGAAGTVRIHVLEAYLHSDSLCDSLARGLLVGMQNSYNQSMWVRAEDHPDFRFSLRQRPPVS